MGIRNLNLQGCSKQFESGLAILCSSNSYTHLHNYTRAYVKRRGPRRKGVNMDVILSSLSLMAASLLAMVRGIAIIMQAVITPVMW